MSNAPRNERIAARRSKRGRSISQSRVRSNEQAIPPSDRVSDTAIFEPLERRQLLSTTTTFESLAVGNLGSAGYVDAAGYKFLNLPGGGGTSQGDLYVYGTSQGYTSKVISTHNWDRKIVVSRNDGATFDLASFDYGAGRWGEAGDATVTAFFGNGSTSSMVYSFSSRSMKKLSTNWTALKRVEINFRGGTNSAYGAVDNFVFGSGSGGGGGGTSGTANFENLNVGNLGSSTYKDPSGLSFASLNGTGGTTQYNMQVHGTSQGFSSKVLQSENWGQKLVVKKSDGSTFDLASFDYGAGRWGEAGDATVTGYFSNGTSTKTTYSFSSKSFKKLSLGWTGLKSVEINFHGGTNATYGAVDNFVISGGSTDGGGGGGDSGGGGSAVKPDAKISAASSLNIMSGMAVHVNALSTAFGVGDMDTARMEWDFGDPNGKRNTMVGWNAAHLYESPGTYTIRLKVWNQDRGFDDATVTVNVASNTRKKIYVSPSGSDSNSGTSTSPVRTIPRAVDLMRANNGNVEILLQRGQRHDLAATQSIDRPNVVIGAYGSGGNPVIWWTRGRYDTKAYFLLGYGTSNITVRDLTFDTPYGSDTDATNMPHAVQPAGTNVTIYNNEFRHVGDAVAGNAVPKAVLVLQNRVPTETTLRRYFAWIEGSDWTLMDNTVPNSTREHIVRVGNGARINVSHNNFTNLDRRGVGDPYDYAKGVINIQKGSYAYVAHNVTKGPSGVGPLGGGDGLHDTGSRFKHAVFEGNRFNGPFHIEHGAEEIEVRNNIIHSNIELAFAVQGYNSSYNRTSKNVRIVNNTGLNYNDWGQFMRVWAGTSGMIVSNNLYYAPKLYAGPMETAVVRVDANNLNGFSKINNNVWADADWLNWAGGLMWVGTGTENSGYLDKNEWLALPQVSSDKFSDVSIDSSFKPASGSVAATAGTRVPGVMVDFYGKWRPDSDGRTVGAVTN